MSHLSTSAPAATGFCVPPLPNARAQKASVSGGGRTTQDEWQRLFERFDTDLNGVCVRLFDEALTQAWAADQAFAQGHTPGPLHGVPITMKEANDVIGTAPTWGFGERADHVATEDAEAVRRLREAGAVLLGKTNVPVSCADWQSVNPLYGRTCNP